jgi:hypothetical protein
MTFRKRSTTFFALCLFHSFFSNFVYGQVLGKVTNTLGEPLSFITIYDNTYAYNTVSNINGAYSLALPKGRHTINFQYLGFKTQSITLTIGDEVIEKNVMLEKERYDLPEVVILSNGEDPSYPIIRSAIKLKKANKYPLETYKADVYGKGMIMIKDAPEKFMGMKIGNMGGMIDSNKQGIIYLSESVSEISYQKPDYYFEKVLANKVSGDGGGFSVSSFSRSNITLYEETTDYSRPVVSPLADAAFSYYKFRLAGSFIDQSGAKIYKINVIPKSETGPSYQGDIFIVDETFHIYSVDLMISGKRLQSPIIDTLHLTQLYKPIKENKWAIISQNMDWKAKLMGFKANGYFNYIFLDYNPGVKIDNITKEVLRFDPDATSKKDSFWNKVRPIPLTIEEAKDYIKKDSLQILWESKPFLDSIDKVNNKFTLADLFFGYFGSKSMEKLYFRVNPPLNTIQFNAVEGWNVSIPFSLRKEDKDDDFKWDLQGFAQYGFSDKRFKYGAKGSMVLNKFKLSRLGFVAYRKNDHFDENRPISSFSNSIQSLFFKNNYAKYYDRTEAKIFYRSEITNGLLLSTFIDWEKRQSLDNTTNFSYRKKEQNYLPNNIRNSPNYVLDDRVLGIDLELRFRPGQKFMSLPTRKARISSSWPDFNAQIYKAIPINGQYADFTKLKVWIRDSYVSTNRFGYFNYQIELGRFLNKNRYNDPDLFHFSGNDLLFSYNTQFKNFPFYSLSSERPYLAFFYEHHFEGYFTDRIPLLNKTNLRLVSSFATLQRQNEHHTEIGLGFEGFGIGAINLFRLDYVYTFGIGGGRTGVVKVVLTDIFRLDTDF